MTDKVNFTCQKFGWSTEKRFEFLKHLNDGNDKKLFENLLQPLSKESFDQATTVRVMDDVLTRLACEGVPLRLDGSCTSCGIM
jgi:hypothetical protein